MNARAPQRPMPARIAVPLAVVMLLPGCGLILDLDPPDGAELECSAQVRSVDGHTELVSSTTSPDFVVVTTSPDGSTETASLRNYFLCTGGCPSSCMRDDSIAGAEADWQSWLAIRVREQSSVATSVFGQFAGPWCLEPGSLRCSVAGTIDGNAPCPGLPAGDPSPLPLCAEPPPPPPGDPCLRIECDGTAPCETIDFGDVNVAASATRTVIVSNCGGTAAPDISLTLSGDVLPQPAFAQGDFAVTRNQCLPDTPDEVLAGEEILTNPLTDAVNSRCEVDVTFSPDNPRAHGAEIAFRSDLDPRHSILLRGNGAGGTVTTVPALPDPTLCFDTPGSPCTAVQSFRISNSGPGAVVIRDIRLDTGAPNFEIVAPPPASLPITLNAADPPLLVSVRWCDGPPPTVDLGGIVIDTNAPGTPTIMIKLVREAPGMC